MVRLPIAILAISIGSPAVAQSTAPISQQDFVTSKFYIVFFDRVKTLERFVAHDAETHADPLGKVPKLIENEAQLTDQQWAGIKSIADDCNAALDSNRKQRSAFIQQYRDQNPGATSYTPAAAQQVQAYYTQFTQIILDHVNQIKTALGDTRFQQFDAYVRAKIAPMLASPTPPPTPTKK